MKRGAETCQTLLFLFCLFYPHTPSELERFGPRQPDERETVDPSLLSASSLSRYSSGAWRAVSLQIIPRQTDRISRALLAEGN